MCNNVLELVGNPYTIGTDTELHPDPEYWSATNGSNPGIRIEISGNFWQDIVNFFKNNWEVLLGTFVSYSLIVGGVAVTICSGGSLSPLGGVMIGTGLGGFIGGLKSAANGGSYWGGYLGGAVSGGLASLGVVWGLPFILGAAGNLAGSAITDAINGKDLHNLDYWAEPVFNALIAGLVNMGAWYFGQEMEILKISKYRDIYAGFSVWAEFVFTGLTEDLTNLFKSFVTGRKSKFID